MTSSYKPHWDQMELSTIDPILGRHRHSCCVYSNKIIIFGGCFMYSMQRESRETTNQLLVYDTMYNTYNIVQQKGVNVTPRRDHCATAYGKFLLLRHSVNF